MIKDGQVRELFWWLDMGKPLASAARMTEMDQKTARKYRRAKQLPSQLAAPRHWRTRQDPFAEVWPGIEHRLRDDPALQAVTLFRWLQGQQPGEFPDSQRRTFERKVHAWRATQGPNRPVMFAQVHHPGDLAASDFTHMDALKVTIAGQPFAHLAYHFTLTYSNWESVTVCPSESFEALSEGLQNALWELGGVPRRHRSDSLSAAVNNLSEEREFRQRYLDLLASYGLEGQRINVCQPHENGDAESSHGHFKNTVDQALRLRGSRDFANREEYLQFLRELVALGNARRQKRFAEERAVLRPLPPQRLASSRRLTGIGVGVGSTIQVLRNTYSVHSRLIGETVDVVIGVEEVEVWHAGVLVQRMPRLPGDGKHAINYRHIIDSLVRKPGAFANYQYREELFPTSHFRMAYDALCRQHAQKHAAREYLRILQLAARESESAVQEALRAALARGEELSFAAVQAAVQRSQHVPALTEVQVAAPDLREFDSLLDHSYMEVGSHEFTARQEVFVAFLDDEAAVAATDAAEPAAAEGIPAGPLHAAAVPRGTAGAVPGASPADVPRALPEAGGAGGAGVAGACPVPGGVDAAGVPDAPRASHPAAAGAVAVAACEELGELRLATDPLGRRAASGEPAGRVVPGPAGEPVGLRQAGLGEDALRVRVGRAAGASGPFAVVYHLRPVGADLVGGQTGLAAGEGDQAIVAVRGPDPRRPRLRAAQPRGDGGALHVVGGALRAGQRAVDEQPALLAVGAGIQGRHDHSRGHRPTGASLCGLGTERPQLSARDRAAQPANGFHDSARYGREAITPPHSGIPIVAKAEE